MKKSLHVKSSINYPKPKIIQNAGISPNSSRVRLAPLAPITDECPEKALELIISKMEAYVLKYPGEDSSIVSECLSLINKHLPSTKNPSENLSNSLANLSHRFPYKEPLVYLNIDNLPHSQFFSERKEILLNLQNRRFFDKPIVGKSNEELSVKGDKEIISELQTKLTERDSDIRQLQNRIEEFSLQMQEKQQIINTFKQRKMLFDAEKQSLVKQQLKFIERISFLQLSVSENELRYKQSTKSMLEKYDLSKSMLMQREQQMTGLWQSYLLRSQAYIH